MNSRERVSAALRRTVPDRVPYCETGIDRAFADRLMGWREPISQAANLEVNQFTVEEAKAIARKLGMDNIPYVLRAPVYAEKHPGMDGRLFYGNGLIKTRADLPMLQLPDPRNDALYEEAERFARNKDTYSAWFVTRVGIFPTWLSMGIERFCIALYDDRSFVEEVLDTYCDWAAVVAERACQLGFDVFVSTDDMAFKTGPFFSPDVFRELVLPRFRRVATNITLPWVVHSDGNIVPFLDDLVDLGISGIHPIEEGAMDIRAMKRDYGGKLCLLGNVDLNILGSGSRTEVLRTVESLIHDVGPGGGYIVTSGNSLAGYLRPENALAMSEAVRQYGRYPL
jgi:uroporphyrinogen decarboxylase